MLETSTYLDFMVANFILPDRIIGQKVEKTRVSTIIYLAKKIKKYKFTKLVL